MSILMEWMYLRKEMIPLHMQAMRITERVEEPWEFEGEYEYGDEEELFKSGDFSDEEGEADFLWKCGN